MRVALPLGLIGFVVAVAVWPHIPALATAPRWAALSFLVPLFVAAVPVRMTPAHWCGVAFLAYAALSWSWALVGTEAVNALWQWAVLAGAFCLGAAADDLKWFYWGLWLGLLPNVVIAASQYFGIAQIVWSAAEHGGAHPAGTFGNKNIFAEFAGLVLVGTIGPWRRLSSWRAVVPAIALVLTGCFEVLAAMTAAFVVWLWSRSRKWAIAVALPLAIFSAILASGKVLPSVHHLSGLEHREAIWGDAIADLKFFGHGVGSYYTTIAAHSPRQRAFAKTREEHLHNDALELIYDLGVPGLVLIAVIVGYAFGAPLLRERFLLVAFLVEGFFGFPLHMPTTSFIAAVVVGRLSGARDRLRRGMADGGIYDCPGMASRLEAAA